MKKLLSTIVFLSILAMSTLGINNAFADNNTEPQKAVHKFKPGIYNDSIKDKWKELKISVDLAEDHVKAISLLNPEVLAKVSPKLVESFNQVAQNIITENSPYVDSVTGATSLSSDVKKKVYDIMTKAKNEAIISEGGNPADKSVDVVVIGSGGAGLSAAIQAYDDGAKVLIVEKMPVIGGNTTKSSAGMNAAETKFQEAVGIKDKKELFYEETLKGGKGKNNPELLHYFVENAPNAIDWLDKNGIELSNITTTGGMSIDRTHRPADGSAVGGYLIKGLIKNINKRSIDVLLNTSAVELLQENGVLKGVKVLDEETKEESIIKTKAVVVATGGFSANSAMVVKYKPNLAGFVTTNHKGATGGGIVLLEKLGAGTVDMDQIQIHPTVEQSTSFLISESIRGGGAILVSQAGKRFFNELETRDKVSAAIIALPEKYSYIMFDQQVREKNKAIETYIKKGLVVQGKTVEELATKLKIDPKTLVATIERYNTFVEKKQDEDFNRTTGMRSPLNKADFYAVKIAPGVHHTMGGVTINTNAEVLTTDKQVIKGVYAAGEVVGGIHGANRIGGNAVADIIIYGIQAGKEAAKFTK